MLKGRLPTPGALRREARSQGRAFLLEHTRLSGCHLGFVDWCHLIYFFIKHLLSTYCATGSGLGPGDPEVPKTSPVSTFGGSVQRRRRTFQQANETLSNSHASREGSETTSNKIKCLRSKIDPPESARGRLRTGRMLAQRQSNSLKVFTRSKRKELTSQGGTLADAVHGLQVDIAGYETWLPQRLRGPRSHADAMLLLWDTHDLSRIVSRRQTDPAPGAVHTIPGDALQSDKVGEDRGRRRSRPRTLGDATANRGERPQLGPWTGGRWWRSWGSSSEVRRFLGNAVPVPVPCELGF